MTSGLVHKMLERTGGRMGVHKVRRSAPDALHVEAGWVCMRSGTLQMGIYQDMLHVLKGRMGMHEVRGSVQDVLETVCLVFETNYDVSASTSAPWGTLNPGTTQQTSNPVPW